MFGKLFLPLLIAVISSSSVASLVTFFVTRKDNKDDLKATVDSLIQFKDETENKINILKQGHVALLHNSLFKTASDYLIRGYITVSELDNLTYLYDAYHELGGNGTGDLLMRKIAQLEIRED